MARVSRLKAEAIEAACEDVVIAADTIVVLDGHILGKPADEADAVRMLTALSGKSHQVMTGVTVKRGSRCITHTEITDIHFRELSEKEIKKRADLVASHGKAGRFAEGVAPIEVMRPVRPDREPLQIQPLPKKFSQSGKAVEIASIAIKAEKWTALPVMEQERFSAVLTITETK